MSRFLKSAGFKILIVVLAALTAGSVISVASRSGSSPVTAVVSVVFGPVSKFAGSITSAFEKLPITFKSSSYLKRENAELQAEIDNLRERLVDHEQLIHKNEFYKEFLDLKEDHEDYTFAEAAVIGRDAAGHFGSFTLDKGSGDDIKVNDPVIYGKYLVGVVASVTPTQCTVNTILNPAVNVSCYETRTREVGYVTTTVELAEKGQCQIPGLSARTAVTAGGLVCTAGVGGVYPRDLIIGTVEDILDATLNISASAIVKPGVDFSQITDVFIITNFDGQAQ